MSGNHNAIDGSGNQPARGPTRAVAWAVATLREKPIRVSDAGLTSVLASASVMYAFLSIYLVSRRLGVSPLDFGLGVPEYILLAGFWFLYILFPLAFFLLGLRLVDATSIRENWTTTRRNARFCASVVMFTALILTFNFVWAPGSVARGVIFVLAMIAIAAIVAFAVIKLFPIRTDGAPVVAAVAMVALLALSGLVRSHTWAGDLTESNVRAPLPLDLILTPSSGTTEVGGQCFLRLAKSVLTTDGSTTVRGNDYDFFPTECETKGTK